MISKIMASKQSGQGVQKLQVNVSAVDLCKLFSAQNEFTE